MSDPFKNHAIGMSDPVEGATSVVPNDTTDLTTTTRAVFIGTGGNLRVTLVSGDIVTFTGISGGWHPLRVNRIWNTGTTATAIVGCY